MATTKTRSETARLNGAKGKGPVTLAGKQTARANSLAHGMTGQGVVLREEDRDAVEQTERKLVAELNPRCTLGRFLLHQLAVYMVRLLRAAAQEEAAIAFLVRHAAAQFDDQRLAAPEAELEKIRDQPLTSARRLHETAEGLGLLIRCWLGLWDDLEDPRRWGYVHWERAENLMGRRPHEAPVTRLSALCQAAMGQLTALAPEDGAGLDEWERRVWAAGELRSWIEARVAELRGRLAKFDQTAVERDRAEAGKRALFDPSPAAVLARKYEAMNQRFLFRTLQEYYRVEAEAAAREAEMAAAAAARAPEPAAAAVRAPEPAAEAPRETDVKPEIEKTSEPLGSFFPGGVSVASELPAGPSGGPVRGVSGPPEVPGTVGGGRSGPGQPPG
jgi:hypothetical protein